MLPCEFLQRNEQVVKRGTISVGLDANTISRLPFSPGRMMAEDTNVVNARAGRTHSYVDDVAVARAEQLDQYPWLPRAWDGRTSRTAVQQTEASECLSNTEDRAESWW